ncbi:MAG TPA: type II toxin-antitoxin system VapC family toxin [Bryobacteraceae bacterium]|nr:type II toxin-antitoxin system VapC family toxin [Bryobacteraceae bacterium]
MDTHVLVRWITERKRLSGEQRRVLEHVEQRREVVAISAMTLIEIASLGRGARRSARETLELLDGHPGLHVYPITIEIATELAALIGGLRDPADCAIVATARVHGLKLITSDQRIIQSKLVSVVE